MFGNGVGAPAGEVGIGAEVAPGGGDGGHAGGVGGLDIADVVAHIDAVGGGDVKMYAGGQ